MKQNDLIGIFEGMLPSDLVCQIHESRSEKSKSDFNATREFLLKEAAEVYFNTFIRKVLMKQVEMRESGSTQFHPDWMYNEETMNKYMNMLSDDDELKIRWEKKEFGDFLDQAKDFGLV